MIWVAYTGTWGHVISGPCCLREPCLGLWPYRISDLWWCPWPILPLKAMWIHVVWATTWSHVDVRRPCYHCGHTNLNNLHCHRGLWWCLGLSCSQGPWLCPVQCLTETEVCVDGCGSCYHWEKAGCLGTREMGQILSAYLMGERLPLQEELVPKAWAAIPLHCYFKRRASPAPCHWPRRGGLACMDMGKLALTLAWEGPVDLVEALDCSSGPDQISYHQNPHPGLFPCLFPPYSL